MTTAEDAHSDLLRELVDCSRYPLQCTDVTGSEAVVAAQHSLADDGCAVMPDFVRPAQQQRLVAECLALAEHAHRRVEIVNVYNTDPGADVAADHPGRRQLLRGNAFVPFDRIPQDAVIHRLYVDSRFQRFIAACLGLPRIYPLADPLAALCVNVVDPDREHPWHFDTNEFAVSLLIQPAESGGDFEYCPDIRSVDDENLAGVRAVLDGGRDRVRTLPLRTGDLQLFRGRYSMHRVSTVRGSSPRYTAIFSYSAHPGVVGRPERTRQLFGRLTASHGTTTQRADRLLD